jgi:ribosomal protein S18 acetylase RimI-like enzyme
MAVSVFSDRSLGLRAATPDDEPLLLRVYASTRSGELAQVEWSDEQKAAFVRQQFAAQSQYYRDYYSTASFDVILCEDQPVGRLYVARWSNEIRIVDIALLSEWCGRGIGTSLLQQLQAEARASNKALSIHVERFNPALRLYTRLGFQPIEDKGVYLFLEWKEGGSSPSEPPADLT